MTDRDFPPPVEAGTNRSGPLSLSRPRNQRTWYPPPGSISQSLSPRLQATDRSVVSDAATLVVLSSA